MVRRQHGEFQIRRCARPRILLVRRHATHLYSNTPFWCGFVIAAQQYLHSDCLSLHHAHGETISFVRVAFVQIWQSTGRELRPMFFFVLSII